MTTKPLTTQQAAKYFKQGDYKKAIEYYRKAEIILGKENIKANILLCELRIKNKNQNNSLKKINPINSDTTLLSENLKLKQHIADLKNTLSLKEKNIQERFQELAILTKLLEEKN